MKSLLNFQFSVCILCYFLFQLSLAKFKHFINELPTGDATYLQLYGKYLVYTNLLGIKTICADEKCDLDYFTDNIVLELSNNKKPSIRSVRIENERVVVVEKRIPLQACTGMPSPLYRKMRPKKNVTRKKIEFFSCVDSSQGNVIVAENDEMLVNYLKKKNWSLFPDKSRSLHLIVVSSPSDKYLENVKFVLKSLWREQQVLNVIIHTTHCLHSSFVHVYRPFEKRPNGDGGDNYGITRKYNIHFAIKQIFHLYNTAKDLNRYPLTVRFFSRRLSSLRAVPKVLEENVIYKDVKKVTGFHSYDPIIIYNLAKDLDFAIKPTYSNARNNFGTVTEDGLVANGTIATIIRKEASISGNGRFLVYYNSTGFEYTQPYYWDKICVVVPKSRRVPQWQTIYKCFTLPVWSLVLVFVMIIVTLNYIMFGDGGRTWLHIVGLIFSNSIIYYKSVSRRSSDRIFLTSCLIFTVIVGSSFSGAMLKFLTRISYYADLSSLEDLDESGLQINTKHVSYYFKPYKDVHKRLIKKVTYLNTNYTALHIVAFNRSYAAVERYKDAEVLIDLYFTNQQQQVPLLCIIKEDCLLTYNIAYIVSKGLPILPVINDLLLRYFQAGLLTKWESDYFGALILEKKYSEMFHEEPARPLSFSNMQPLTYVLLIGYLMSFLIFLVERFVKYFRLTVFG